MQVKKYTFQIHGDDRGQLVALEEAKDIPFKIKPPFGMSCVTFAECLETIKVVDIQ